MALRHNNLQAQPHENITETTNDPSIVNGHTDEPPLKKRKVNDQHVLSKADKSRPVSPPWKRAGIEGPASFVEDGRRKSSRTNAIPLDLRPQSGKRQTRATIQNDNKGKTSHLRRPYGRRATKSPHAPDEVNEVRQASNGALISRPSPRSKDNTATVKAHPRRNVLSSIDGHNKSSPANHRSSSRHLHDTSPDPSLNTSRPKSPSERNHRLSNPPTNHIGTGPQRHNVNNSSQISQSPSSSALQMPKLQRIKFRVSLPSVDVTLPAHVLPAKKFSSFREWFDKDTAEPQNGAGRWDQSTIEEKAAERYHFLREQRPGGLLTDARLIDPEAQEAAKHPPPEPSRQYGHHDHLVAHAIRLRYLQEKEAARHRKNARVLARQALDHPLHLTLQRNRRLEEPEVPMTQEMIVEQQHQEQEARYKRLIRDIERQWDSVRVEVQSLRLAEWDEEQRELGKEHLNRVLEHHKEMLKTRQIQGLDESDGGDEGTASESESISSEASEKDSNMSTGEEESSDESDLMDDDQDLTADQLRQKYADLPDQASGDKPNLDDASVLNNNREIGSSNEDVDHTPPSAYHSDRSDFEADDSNDDKDGYENEDEDVGTTMLGFFNTSQRKQLVNELERDNANGDMDMEFQQPPESNDPFPDLSLDISRGKTSPSVDLAADSSSTKVAENTDSADTLKELDDQRTPVPSLLRGKLREYQHDGLDWLARQYASYHNGILADEMGLGKTIQTIALLAHLAVEHEVWGPHLIVVPTSVMLNWEMEFKKWCPGFKIMTYYGTIDERKQKRRGWMDDDLWNVCITSYQLVLQDQQAFKRRNWHYMILDEAHNIKNFRSQRWQALLGFKTRARLLLTGTPLQNNLSELWSLLFFLNRDHDAFANLSDFSSFFGKAVGHILEHGRETINDDDKKQISELQTVLRPYLLRRLKADVEKQMPAKYEHVEMCRLSKRQRQLYDGFMSRAQTKETLASGNYLSIINCLMQLRKVCNHPDLFETRPVTTSFAMSKSAAATFEIHELLVRRQLLQEQPASKASLDYLNLAPISREDVGSIDILDTSKLLAEIRFQKLRTEQSQRVNTEMHFVAHSRSGVIASLENIGRQSRLAELDRILYHLSQHQRQKAMWGSCFMRFLTSSIQARSLSPFGMSENDEWGWLQERPSALQEIVPSLGRRAHQLEPIIQKFACLTPSVVAPNMAQTALTKTGVEVIQEAQTKYKSNPFHEAQTRLAIAFPDKRLLQYDCGKLQRLDKLLRDLQAGSHRALIFTQMTKVLDILEQFLNIHGHRYLRLDGATKVEQRQILTDRFNNDTRILAFILSSRSGGLGINLTGADTVIFYDLDWNPAMDKQCQDRCHRIGQTRDVHIYRFVSEHTIESNILRKSNQKRMLDDVVIQEGDFTTDYFNKLSVRDMIGDDLIGAEDMPDAAALDRVLGSSSKGAISQVEDREDAAAANAAEKEVQHADDADFSERTIAKDPSATPVTPGPGTGALPTTREESEAVNDQDNIDDGEGLDEYLVRTMRWMLKDVPVVPELSKKKSKTKKGQEHRVGRPRRQ
ncbi:MAG: hypothetical protein Q9160_000463 [Pyrenula sp. 1 TL-2023]